MIIKVSKKSVQAGLQTRGNEPARYLALEDGEERSVPSVTSILQDTGLSSDFSQINSTVLGNKTAIGDVVHQLIANYLRDEDESDAILDRAALNPDLVADDWRQRVLAYFQSWLDWYESRKGSLTVHAVEHSYVFGADTFRRFDERSGRYTTFKANQRRDPHKIAGTFDLLAWDHNRSKWLILDWKTCQRLSIHALQGSGYMFLACNDPRLPPTVEDLNRLRITMAFLYLSDKGRPAVEWEFDEYSPMEYVAQFSAVASFQSVRRIYSK